MYAQDRLDERGNSVRVWFQVGVVVEPAADAEPLDVDGEADRLEMIVLSGFLKSIREGRMQGSLEVKRRGGGELSVMDVTGDTKVLWDIAKEDEVDAARETFRSLRAKGYLAYAVKGKDGEKSEQIHEFDPDAGRIIMSPPLVGG